MTRRARLAWGLLAAATALLALARTPVELPAGDDFRTPSVVSLESTEALLPGRVIKQELSAKGRVIRRVAVRVIGGSDIPTPVRVQLRVHDQQGWRTLAERTHDVVSLPAGRHIKLPVKLGSSVRVGDRLAVLVSASEVRGQPVYVRINKEFVRSELALFANEVPMTGTLQIMIDYKERRGPLVRLLPAIVRRLTILMRPGERAIFYGACVALFVGFAWLLRMTWQDVKPASERGSD